MSDRASPSDQHAVRSSGAPGAWPQPAESVPAREPAFACEIRYLNFDFAGLLGVHDYVWVTHQIPYTAFAGDWCFTEQLHGPQPSRDQAYVDQVLRGDWRLSDTDVRRVLRVRSLAGLFLDHCMASIDWSRYDVVGFTSTFEQNIASLALAKRIKRMHPSLRIVFGGANWEGEMGVELHRQFPFVDFVCSGESEVVASCARRIHPAKARIRPPAASSIAPAA